MALNRFYLENRELWDLDFSWDGFEWIYPDMSDLNIIAFRRMDKKGNELVMAFNFSPVTRYGFEIKPLTHARYIEAFSTDDEAFGGSGIRNQGALDAVLYDTDDGGEENRSAGEEETHD